MAKAKFQIQGLQELFDLAHRIPPEIGMHAKKLFNDFGEDVMEEAKKRCPYDPKRKSGTHLRDTAFIRKAESNVKPNTWIGFGAPHAYLVHEDIAGFHRVKEHSTAGTGPKYLERPFLEKKANLEAKIVAMIDEVTDAA